MGLSIDGLVTGIDTQSIIDGLLRIQKSRADAIGGQKTKIETERTAFISYEAQLLALQSSLRPISRTAGNALTQKHAVSSDSDALTATVAGSRAVNGTYRLKIEQLASTHQLASQSFSDPEQAIGTGDFTVTVGGAETKVTITSANDTLQGLADAINSANGDVTASIVSTGSLGAATYRMLLTSRKSGSQGEMSITNGLNTLVGNAIRPAFTESYIGNAAKAATNVGTAKLTANSGVQTYTGGVDDTFTFTVGTGGTVGTTNGITLNYANASGTKTGTVTFNTGEADTFKSVTDGIQVKLDAATLSTGDSFSLKVYAKQPPIQAARDAVVAFGDGDEALRLSSSNNTMADALPGVTLNLLQADPAKEIQLEIGYNSEAIVESVQTFVDTYNQFIDFVSEQTRYVAETDSASPLTGNRTILGIGAKLRNEMVRAVGGVNTQADTLNEMGINFDASSKMVFRQDRLEAILRGDVDGVRPDDLQKLFGFGGTSTSPAVTVNTATDRTLTRIAGLDGRPVDVKVRVTQAATKATLSGAATADSLVISNANNKITARLNGASKEIVLSNGTYTRDQMASEISSEILNTFGRPVAAVSVNGSTLSIQSTEYGLSQSVEIIGGSALATLGFTAGDKDSGSDVAGEFVVVTNRGLVREKATGKGQVLSGQTPEEEDPIDGPKVDRAITAGLQVTIKLGEADIAAEDDATVTLTQGLGFRMQRVISDSLSVPMQNAKDSYAKKLESLDKSLVRVNAVFDARREALLREFSALEQSVSGYNSVSQLITGQLSSFRL